MGKRFPIILAAFLVFALPMMMGPASSRSYVSGNYMLELDGVQQGSDWISASWKQNYQRKAGAVVATDYNYNAKSQRQFTNALLTATTIPAILLFLVWKGPSSPC